MAFPVRGGGHPFMGPEEFIKMALVREAHLIADLLDGVGAVLQSLFDQVQFITADVIPEGDACLLFKKDAQIVPGVTEFFGQVFQLCKPGRVDMTMEIVDDGAGFLCVLGAAMGKTILYIPSYEGKQGLHEEKDRLAGAAHCLFPLFRDEPDQCVGLAGLGAVLQEGRIPALGFHEQVVYLLVKLFLHLYIPYAAQVDVGEFKEGELCLFFYFEMMGVAGGEQEEVPAAIGIMRAGQTMPSFSFVNEDDLKMIVVMHGVFPPGGGEMGYFKVLVLDIPLHGGGGRFYGKDTMAWNLNWRRDTADPASFDIDGERDGTDQRPTYWNRTGSVSETDNPEGQNICKRLIFRG